VDFEIIARNASNATRQDAPEDDFYGTPVDSARVIEIELSPSGRGKIGTVKVKVVERKAHRMGSESPFEFLSEPGFSRTAAASDSHQDRGRFFGDGSRGVHLIANG
jgi:hypothetical protein